MGLTRLLVLAGLILYGVSGSAAQKAAEKTQVKPETVMVTFRPKPGSEAELARVIEKHWATARRLNLILPSPHVTMRGAESGNKTYFVDVFTWRDAGIPDAAPAEIRSIWDEMNRLVEARDGRPGLDFAAVDVVNSK